MSGCAVTNALSGNALRFGSTKSPDRQRLNPRRLVAVCEILLKSPSGGTVRTFVRSVLSADDYPKKWRGAGVIRLTKGGIMKNDELYASYRVIATRAHKNEWFTLPLL
jgi:hypothetical protein